MVIVPDAGIVLAERAVKRVTASRGQAVTVGFRATAAARATRAKVGFAAKSASRPELKDGAESSFAVHPPVIERRDAVAGTVTAAKPFDVGAVTPARWRQQDGRCDVLLSGSPFLPKLAGLPALLDAQGSLEKIASRVLAATVLSGTLDYLPPTADMENQLRASLRDGLARLAASTLEDGGVPAWPAAGKAVALRDDWVTVEAAWAIRSAMRASFAVDEKLAVLAERWLRSIIEQEEGFDGFNPSLQCFALMAYGSTLATDGTESAKQFETRAEELFDKRVELGLSIEGRAWLALGMHFFGLPGTAKEALEGT